MVRLVVRWQVNGVWSMERFIDGQMSIQLQLMNQRCPIAGISLWTTGGGKASDGLMFFPATVVPWSIQRLQGVDSRSII